MATNKNHFLAFLLFPHFYEVTGQARLWFNPNAGTEVIMNDSMRCWTGPREFTHFTINPVTGEVSWATFPEADVSLWTKQMVQGMEKFSAGKPGVAVIDEPTIPEEFWKHNAKTEQNKRFFLHLIQDKAYDRFIHAMINISRRYEDIYVFNGEVLTGAQLRGQGMERWTTGIINELDDQFFVRLAKMYFEATGEKADRTWIEQVMKAAIQRRYPADLAEATLRFVSLSDKAQAIIESGNFDEEVWLVRNWLVDIAIQWMLDDMHDAILQLGVFN